MTRKITKDDLAAAARVGPFCAVHFLIDGKTVVKTGENTRLAEANTMRFIRENTNIPVPEVYDAYTHDETGHVCIVMERVEGQTLQEAWPSYDDADKETVVQQLRGYFNELRRFKSPTISCTDGSPCDDQYIDDDIGGYGPYSTEESFNQGLVRAWTKGREDDSFIRFLCKTLLHMMQGHEFVMTHNDFAPRNILVRGSQVVAILDWELSGYFPEYWEFAKALWRPAWDSPWMKDDLVERVLDPYYQQASLILNTSYTIW
ncbi:aminoglycoside 3'-phosphotransferase/choline kinase domain protein [Metarhizium robertsii]|uniref:Protein kinase, catalytic domain protein n=2 Tax=Metarhizium robertsii TaxID=568076 RepID=E9FCJ8_METRA|nr:Protein kinase, catalytic domain protein [Metarhizium robertsii ARSEF 23]EFY94564.1 Protein kinase, catalytic domain protein [Metarhizium robertsii ARSEF 23]EXU95115.1 aminoglycoside 3'-phosphotransferase/choline kinase domain protein [Metarhizium robertsii]